MRNGTVAAVGIKSGMTKLRSVKKLKTKLVDVFNGYTRGPRMIVGKPMPDDFLPSGKIKRKKITK